MQVYAKLRYLRIAPRKVRLVADLIRGKSVEEAQNILNFTPKRATLPLLKLLKSAIANAKNNFHLEESNLYLAKILVDEGSKLKRLLPRARGKADVIQKKTSHVTIILDEIPKESIELMKEEIVKEAKEAKKVAEVEKVPKIQKPKFRPGVEIAKPKKERGIKKVFRRTAY